MTTGEDGEQGPKGLAGVEGEMGEDGGMGEKGDVGEDDTAPCEETKKCNCDTHVLVTHSQTTSVSGKWVMLTMVERNV